MTVRFATAMMLLLMLAPVRAAAPTMPDWDELYDKDGIKGWGRQVPQSSFHQWRGEVSIDADFYSVVAVFMDSDRSCEWLSDCVANYYLEKSDLDHQVTYNRTYLPWPFQDRVLVFGETYTFDRKSRSVEAVMQSIVREDAPDEDDVVRAELVSSTFRARYVDDDTTWVQVTLLLDPKGYLPAWLVNAMSKSWPYETLRDLRDKSENAKGFDELIAKLRQAHPFPM